MDKWYFKWWFIVILLVVGVFTFSWGVGFLFCVAGLILWAMSLSEAKKKKAELPDVVQQVKIQPVPLALSPKPAKKSMSVKRSIGDFRIKYKYDGKKLAIIEQLNPDFSKLQIYDEITFIPEPDNPHDPGAIKAMNNGSHIGYVYKGKDQDMIRDWLKKEEPIYSVITNIDNINKNIEYFIAYYKNPFESIDRYEQIKTKLTKTSKKFDEDYYRQDTCQVLERGETLTLDYDDETETFVAKNDLGDEAGELSKAISKKIMEKFDEYEPICLVEEMTEDDNGKYGADLLIYLK